MLFIFGVLIGSFISALTWRYTRGISNINGRSFCDSCKKELFWFDNIPIISYLLIAGKCRFCKKNISIRYPLIELATGITFLLIGFDVLYLALSVILISILIIDFEHQVIPDSFIFSGLFLVLFFGNQSFLSNLLGGFFASLVLLSLHLFTKGKGMGLGDVKFAVLGGLLVGLKLVPVWLFIAFLTGGLVGTILILGRIAKLKDKIAFGPFLIIAIPITLIWGQNLTKLLHW